MDFVSLKIIDVLDILIVAFLAYQIYRLIRGTAAINIFIGIILFYFVWILCRVLKMELLTLIMGQIIGVGMIALVVVFQPEIRRFLLHLGTQSQNRFSLSRLFLHNSKTNESSKTVNETVEACRQMSETKTGALIAFVRKTNLAPYIESGDTVDATISSRLIQSIFFKNNPLHDGAMIVQGERIVAVRCVLPTTERINIPAHYGMRHRAAIGLTEQTDAVVVVVSEETGFMSYVENGNIKYNVSATELANLLKAA